MSKNWYAVLRDSEDNDWGTGSFDFDEAVKMAKPYGSDAVIAEIDGQYDESGEATTDPICVYEYVAGVHFRNEACYQFETTDGENFQDIFFDPIGDYIEASSFDEAYQIAIDWLVDHDDVDPDKKPAIVTKLGTHEKKYFIGSESWEE